MIIYIDNNTKTNDIIDEYFENYNNIKNINIKYPIINDILAVQYNDYFKIDYEYIYPLIQKYFLPSNNINKIINNIEKKYKLNLNNILAIYYNEINVTNDIQIVYEEFYNKILEIINFNKDIKILIQIDSIKFMDYINSKNLKNIIVINEYKDNLCRLNLFAILIIISKCKYIICSSCNFSLWIMFYRSNNKNVIQHSNRVWYNTIYKKLIPIENITSINDDMNNNFKYTNKYQSFQSCINFLNLIKNGQKESCI